MEILIMLVVYGFYFLFIFGMIFVSSFMNTLLNLAIGAAIGYVVYRCGNKKNKKNLALAGLITCAAIPVVLGNWLLPVLAAAIFLYFIFEDDIFKEEKKEPEIEENV